MLWCSKQRWCWAASSRLSLIVLSHAPLTFTLALFGEFLFQAVAFAVQLGIVFEAIGPNNPLAATTFSFLTAATNVPVTYMIVADGHIYSIAGIAGTLAIDASMGIAACIVAGILLAKFVSKASRSGVESVAKQVVRLADNTPRNQSMMGESRWISRQVPTIDGL
jgi:hypothetical protein